MDTSRRIAYFSMEIGLEASIPTYSGGLGVLAGDTVRAAADLKVPMVAVTLLHRGGYFRQQLSTDGWQTEAPVEWSVDGSLEELAPRIALTIEGRAVQVRAWKLDVHGVSGSTVPVYFLDSDLEGNTPADRQLTQQLYGGVATCRLAQEVILGFGGVRMLRALGYTAVERFHMNEGHSAFLTLALLDERLQGNDARGISTEDVNAVRRLCIFTTHTPVAAGHDKFPVDLVDRVVGHRAVTEIQHLCCFEGDVNMTFLALNLSGHINGVAKRHGEVSRHLFAQYAIDAITNGVHAATLASRPFEELFDQYIPGWRDDHFSLRYALGIPRERLWSAHVRAKRRLVEFANGRTSSGLDIEPFTLGFARRMTAYKRPELLFTDLERLLRLREVVGPLQIVIAGKAHPRDDEGKAIIKRIHGFRDALRGDIRVAFIPNYDMDVGNAVTAGVDLWLNTPHPPLEASGTSGMKAALNAVPSLSVLDGWWIEGCIEGVTGWSFGEGAENPRHSTDSARDAESLYDRLEHVVGPMFARDRDAYVEVMQFAIALNGSFFNTHRMLQQYGLKAYLCATSAPLDASTAARNGPAGRRGRQSRDPPPGRPPPFLVSIPRTWSTGGPPCRLNAPRRTSPSPSPSSPPRPRPVRNGSSAATATPTSPMTSPIP